MITRNWQHIRQLPRFCIRVTHHLVRPGLFGGKLSMLEQSAACLPKLPSSSETQGQIVGARKSLNGRENKARRKVKNGQKI